jgi:capsular polysaccharide export protein
LVKVHPATVAGHKRGYLTDASGPGVELIARAVNPVALLEQVDRVYVCTSQLGFEALLADKPVCCFGAPFYAGWGLTRDEQSVARRGRHRSLDELVAAALLLYPRYRHPVLDELCEAESIIEHLLLQRETLAADRRRFHCLGFTTWKRPFVRRYLTSGPVGDREAARRVRFLRSPRQLGNERFEDDSVIVVWGQRAAPPPCKTRSGQEVPVWRMEDGFLRSVRLGSQLTPPGSLVLDRRGIYYDPRSPSDLEALLNDADFTADEIARAARLRERIVAMRVSKYNLAAAGSYVSRSAAGQATVLVVGQVEDDASVKLGSPRVRSNLELLRAARRLRPDAHLIYKPHPDVLSGNRRADATRREHPWDELVEHVSVASCLEAVDEVHTMTSLVGFEALLRGVQVVAHGLPFYAGWGLTRDQLSIARRRRRLTLDELVAGTLIRYPRYFSWQAKCFCTAEDMVTELARQRDAQRATSFSAPWLLRRVQDVAILLREWLHA